MGPPVELINGWIADGGIWPLLASPFIGSFLGVLILRLPAGLPVLASRSVCPACGHRLGPRELVPFFSFVLQRGRCRACAAPIARFHLHIEFAGLAVALWAATQAGGALLWASCTLGWTLLALGWIDALSQRLPDVLTLPLILAGLGEALVLAPDTLLDRSLGAVFGYAGFRLLSLLYRKLRGREGLGEGDAKLLAAGGAWVGAGALGPVILAASLAGLLWAGLWLRGQAVGGGTRLAFGPFLCLGIWLAWLYAL